MTKETETHKARAGYIVSMSVFIPASTSDLASMSRAAEAIKALEHLDFAAIEGLDSIQAEVVDFSFRHVRKHGKAE